MKDDWAALCVKIREALASTKEFVPDLSEVDEKSLLSKLDEVSKNFTDQADIRRIDVEDLAEKLLNVGLGVKLDKSTADLKSTLYNLAEKILENSNKNENTEYLKLLIYGNYALSQLKLSLINQPDLLFALKKMTHLELTEQKSLKDETLLNCEIIIQIIKHFEMSLPANKYQLILFIKDFSKKFINKKLELLSSQDCVLVFSSFLQIIKFCFQFDLKDYAEKLITPVYDFWEKFLRDYHMDDLVVRTLLRVQFLKVIEEIYQIRPSIPEDSKALLNLIKEHYVFSTAPPESGLPIECKEQVVFSKIDIFKNLKEEIIILEKKAMELLTEKKAEFYRKESLKHVPMITFVGQHYTLDDLKSGYLEAMSLLDTLNPQEEKNIKDTQEFLALIKNPCGDICTYLIEIVRQLQKLELMEEVIFSTQQKLLDLCFTLCGMLTDECSFLSYYHSELYGCKVLTLLSRFNKENDSELKGLTEKLVSIKIADDYMFLNAQIKSIWEICIRYIGKDYGSAKNLVQLFNFFYPLSVKLVAVYDSMLKLELEDAQRIEIYLSMFENFCYLANFYFNQYMVTNKVEPALLNNAKSFINRSKVEILEPLKAMKPGVATRSRILMVIQGICAYQAQWLKTKEGLLLRSLLNKADGFIEIADLRNEELSGTIISIKSLQKELIEGDSKPAFEKVLLSDQSKQTKFPIIQSISLRDQKVNTSNKFKSSTPEKMKLNLEVADSKPVKKTKAKKKKKQRNSTKTSSSGDSAIICQTLAPRTDSPAQAVTEFPKEIKSLPENNSVVKEKESNKKILIAESEDQNTSNELTQNKEKIYSLEKEIKDKDKLNDVKKIAALEEKLAISVKKNQHRKARIKLLENKELQHGQEIKDLNLKVQSAQEELKKQQRQSESTDEIVKRLEQENSALTISVQNMSKSNQQQIEALQTKLEQYERLIEMTKKSLILSQEDLVKSRSYFYKQHFILQQLLDEKDRVIFSLGMQLVKQEEEYKKNSLILLETLELERRAVMKKAIESIIEQKIGKNEAKSKQGVTSVLEQKQGHPPETTATHTSNWSPNFNFSDESSTTAPAPDAMGKSQSSSSRFESC